MAASAKVAALRATRERTGIRARYVRDAGCVPTNRSDTTDAVDASVEMSAGRLPSLVATFASELVDRVATASDGSLIGGYLHGSSALGGWTPTRSDVDVLIVLRDDTPRPVLAFVEAALLAQSSACPGTGLESSVVSVQQAANPSDPWPFLIHVQASHGAEPRLVSGDSIEGDSDLLMHYAVCRSAGIAVFGPDPIEVFGVVSRATILSYLRDELRWGCTHGTEAYAVLNACRAHVFASDGALVSKAEGGRIALARGLARPKSSSAPYRSSGAKARQEASRPPRQHSWRVWPQISWPSLPTRTKPEQRPTHRCRSRASLPVKRGRSPCSTLVSVRHCCSSASWWESASWDEPLSGLCGLPAHEASFDPTLIGRTYVPFWCGQSGRMRA